MTNVISSRLNEDGEVRHCCFADTKSRRPQKMQTGATGYFVPPVCPRKVSADRGRLALRLKPLLNGPFSRQTIQARL
jgi:hypothetical protein